MSKKHIYVVVISLVVVTIVGRLVPHLQNATPVTAAALFISAYLGVRYSLVAVLAVMLASDLVIGFYDVPVMLSVYGSLALASMLGALIKKHKSIPSVISVTLASSLLFFVITNWAVWQFSGMYDPTFAGLMQSYILASPFFRNSLVGDLLYTGMFFGTYALVARHSLSAHRKASLEILEGRLVSWPGTQAVARRDCLERPCRRS